MQAYITALSAFLPNEPVDNDGMEPKLGLVGDLPSRTKKLILRSNKISRRYYALDEQGRITHTNAQMSAEAVRKLDPYPGFSPTDIDLLAAGTSSPDQILPGHGLMVHGELGGGPKEVVTTAGLCLAGTTALKYAALAAAAGEVQTAVAVASEQFSSYMRGSLARTLDTSKVDELEKEPGLAFDADFLRWMLSDGAAAAVIEPTPRKDRISLRIDFIDIDSFAHDREACMYSGAMKNEDGTLTGWRAFPSLPEAAAAHAFLLKQDVKLLNKEITPTLVNRSLPGVVERRGLSPNDFDWYLPHYSSDYFRLKLYEGMKEVGFDLPLERWFTNLSTVGNVGAASNLLMLEELVRSGKVERGQKLFCFIPESGRFSVGWMGLTAV